MTPMLQHPFTLIVEEPSGCDKSTFVIWILECREQLCNIAFKNIVRGQSEKNTPQHLQNVSTFKGVPELENPETVHTNIVLGDLMGSAFSTKVSELFTNESHHCNKSLIPITQNFFNQGPSSRNISLNSKYIVVFKNPRDKTQIVHLARHVYPENISSFHKRCLEVCKDPNSYLFLDRTLPINEY